MPYSYEAKEAIDAYRFVKFYDGGIKKAAAGTDDIIGVTDSINTSECGIADVYIQGEKAEVLSGGTFFAGEALTADENGKAVKASYGDNIGAIALADAVSGDVVPVFVCIQRHFATVETTCSENPQ